MRTATYLVFALVLLVTFVPRSLRGQILKPMPGEITGQVRLPNDAPAGVGALVLLERPDSGVVQQAQTDSQGKFHFRGLGQMPYKITVRAHGYEIYETAVDLTLVSRSFVEIRLRPLRSASKEQPPAAGSLVSARDAQIPPSAVSEFEKGKKLLLDGKNAGKSIDHFKKAVQIYDKFPQAHVLLGVAYLDQQKAADAEQAFQKAIDVDDKATDAYLALGTLQSQQKRFAEAEKNLSKAAELNPESFQAHYELGKSCWALQHNDQAEVHARKALELNSKSAEAHLLMGNVLLRKHQNEDALREFKASLASDPNNPYAAATREMVRKLETAHQNR